MRKHYSIMLAILIFTAASSQLGFAASIGVAWEGQSGITNRVAQGFENGMKEFAPDVQIEYQKELDSIEKVAEFAVTWQKSKNGMVILRSSGAKWLGKNPPSIPSFIGGCNHPGELGAVKNFQAPEGNITGVTYFIPVEKQFDIFKVILPNMTSVLLLIEKGHPSSVIDQEETKAYCAKSGLQYHEQACATLEDLVKAVNEFKDKVSAIIIGNEALVIDNAKAIVDAAGNTPVLSYSSNPVKQGAVGGFAADDVKLGYMLAQSVADVVVKGKAVKDVPVKVDDAPKFFINVKSVEKHGIKIPFTILKAATMIE